MILYHGSKNGIQGSIDVKKSRKTCDFGQGFYTGDRETQPKGLIASWDNHMFYTLDINIKGLKTKEFCDSYTDKMDWALYIGYNRNPEQFENYEVLKHRYEVYNRCYDLIIGVIADDKVFKLLDEFYAGRLCDKALIAGLEQVKLGKQYVFKKNTACSQSRIKIIDNRKLTQAEIKQAAVDNENRKKQTDNIVSQLNTRFRRAQDVKYFDELMEEWNGQ